MRTLPEEYHHEVHHAEIAATAGSDLFFADFSIWSGARTIAYTGDPNRGRIVRIAGSPDHDQFITESFDAFIKIYLRGPSSL